MLSPAPDVWSIRGALGAELPADYVELARRYGPGCFGEFLWLLVPGAGNRNLEMLTQTGHQRGALLYLRNEGEEPPYEPADLIPWAITDNGDVAYFLTSGDPWTVVINESRGPDWYAFDGGVTEFLVAWLSGRERVSVFPDDSPLGPTFRR